MARTIPLADNPLIHPAISSSLLVAAMAAAIAILTGLCGYRKKSYSPSSPHSIKPADSPVIFPPPVSHRHPDSIAPPPQFEPAMVDETNNVITMKDESEDMKDQTTLPLPPAMKTLRETNSCNNFSSLSMSCTQKLSSSLSVKVPRTMSMGKAQDNQIRRKGKLKAEDSILIRPIILGEKCRVPAEEDEAVLYDGKGKRITTYHPKSSASFSLSRTTSIIDQTAISTQEKDKNTQQPDEIS